MLQAITGVIGDVATAIHQNILVNNLLRHRTLMLFYLTMGADNVMNAINLEGGGFSPSLNPPLRRS